MMSFGKRERGIFIYSYRSIGVSRCTRSWCRRRQNVPPLCWSCCSKEFWRKPCQWCTWWVQKDNWSSYHWLGSSFCGQWLRTIWPSVTVWSVGMYQICLGEKKKIVLVPLVMPGLPCANRYTSLLIAGTQRCLRLGSCCNFLYCVMFTLVTGLTTQQQCSSMSMMGPVHCELVATLIASRVIMWCIAWMDMLLGNCMLMIQVEGQGVVGNCGIGQLQHSLSGSMMLYKGAAADDVGGCICFC